MLHYFREYYLGQQRLRTLRYLLLKSKFHWDHWWPQFYFCVDVSKNLHSKSIKRIETKLLFYSLGVEAFGCDNSNGSNMKKYMTLLLTKIYEMKKFTKLSSSILMYDDLTYPWKWNYLDRLAKRNIQSMTSILYLLRKQCIDCIEMTLYDL